MPAREVGSLGFFYINLDRQVDRREHMEAEATLLGVRFSRVSAFDLNTLSENARTSVRSRSFRHERWSLRPFETAVFESHRLAWQAFLATSFETAVIMEDDLVFEVDFLEALTCVGSSLVEFDIVKLNHCPQVRRMGKAIDLGQTHSLTRIFENISDAGCYLLTRKAAEHLLEQSREHCSHLDDFLFSMDRKLLTYQLLPPVASQLVHLSVKTSLQGESLSTRLLITERAEKGPATFRIWKELRRIAKRVVAWWRWKLSGGSSVDMASYMDAMEFNRYFDS